MCDADPVEGSPDRTRARIGLASLRAPKADGGRRLPAPDVTSAYSVVDRGVVSLALAWQGLWILADTRLWPTHQANAATAVAITASLIAWLALLLVHAIGLSAYGWWCRWLDVAALSVAALALLWTTSQQPTADWAAASSMTVLATALAGLLMQTRVAAVWVGVIVAVEAVFIGGLLEPRIAEQFTVAAILYPLYALSLGVLTISARVGVTRDAERADAASADVTRTEQERLTVEGVESAVRREERVLHETVLNTLTAVMRGGVTTTAALRHRLRERCAESARVLRDLQQASERGLVEPAAGQRLDRDLDGALVDLYTSGVSVHVDCDAMEQVPPRVYAALLTACREALSNVNRHARAEAVWITARVTRRGGRVAVSAEVRDDGDGFEEADLGRRFGLQGAVVRGLEEVGGEAVITSQVGVGTTVHLEWVSAEHEGLSAPFRPSAARFAIPVLVSWGVFTSAVVVLTRAEVSDPVPNAVAFSLLIGLSVLVVGASLRGPLPWAVILIVAGVSPLIYQLQGAAIPASSTVPWADWSSAAIVAIFVVAAATGPPWAWLVLLITWLFIQGDVVHELIAPGTAILLAAALYARSTRANAAEVESLRVLEASEQAALAVARESVHRMHRRYGALRESRAIELLEGIARESIDPDDAATRSAAALEERFIRTVIRVDPAIDAVHALATSLAVRARRHGVFLDVDLSGSAPSGPEAGPQGGIVASKSSLSRAVDSSQPGGVARLSARDEGNVFVIRLITPITRGNRDDMLNLPIPGVILDPDDPDMLWEIRVPAEASA